MRLTESQLRKIIRSEIRRVALAEAASEDNHYGEFVDYARSKGVDPDYDEVKSVVGDFCKSKGLDPHTFYSGYIEHKHGPGPSKVASKSSSAGPSR